MASISPKRLPDGLHFAQKVAKWLSFRPKGWQMDSISPIRLPDGLYLAQKVSKMAYILPKRLADGLHFAQKVARWPTFPSKGCRMSSISPKRWRPDGLHFPQKVVVCLPFRQKGVQMDYISLKSLPDGPQFRLEGSQKIFSVFTLTATKNHTQF